MNRRKFITLACGGAIAGTQIAHAQQRERMRHIAVLTPQSADDPEMQTRVAAFLQALQELNWSVGRNLQIEIRHGGNDAERTRKYAAELVALAPEVIVVSGVPALRQVQHITDAMPLVFVQVTDPVGGGFVDSLARPGHNTTGFIVFEYGIGGKWLELLKRVAPAVTRVAVLRDANNPAGTGIFAAVQTVAPSFGVEVRPIDVTSRASIERAVTTFAQDTNGGLIATGNGGVLEHRDLIIGLAARHRLPAIYPFRLHVKAGGLMSYGPDSLDHWRRAAGYVNRILKGEKAGELAVQAPTKFETVINLKTAKALGLTVPDTLLVSADEVIE